MSTPHWRGARHGSRWLPCAMFILGPMALAACGSIAAPVFSATANAAGPAAPGKSRPAASGKAGPAAPGKAVPADLALCANPASASRVVISRSSPVRQIQPEGVLPGQAVVTAAVHVRALANALCALPRMGTGVFHCPVLFEGRYVLRFTAGERHLPAVTIQESGCEIVGGLGPARSASKSREFWTVLAKTLAVASPVRPLFFPDNPPRSYCPIIPDNAVGKIFCPQGRRSSDGYISH
jgi:hypothetical protein